MKILVNALSARMGGIVTYTNNLLDALEQRGLDVSVFVPHEFVTRESLAVHRLDIGHYRSLRRFLWEQLRWRDIVQRFKPDILFSSANFGLLHSPVKQVLLLREGGLFDPFYLTNMTAAQGVPYVANRYFRRRLMLLSAKHADHIITPTHAMRDMVAQWMPSLVDKCTVNPYGTINEMFRPTTRLRRWREDGMLRLLYVSVYYPHKVPSLVCQAVEQLNRSGVPAHARITMSPQELKDMSGSTLDEILVGDAAARGLVTLGRHGYQDLPALYNEHDVFVFPSVSETFGHPMAEAMSCGLPLVVADTPVNREICGDAALYFAPFSVSGLVAAVRRLDADEELRRKLGEIGRARAVQRFGWNDHVDRLIATFEAVARGQAPAALDWVDA
jgi:glycosyltransferase involved in cell wall biosynthesis